MQGSLIKFHILFHCLLDGGQFKMSQGEDRPKGSTFPGAAFLRFPTSQRETCTHRNPVLHRRADHGTDEDQLP